MGLLEFVALMAVITAMTAMSIDAMLPALSEIGMDLGAKQANDSQLVISLLFLGIAVGQMFYGPLSDSIGRKRAMYMGFGLYAMGCVLSMLAANFQIMLVGRVMQGIGAAAPRVIVLALVRDQYDGRRMAQVMSFVQAVFILVPVVAPSFGQAILLFAHWRMIFAVYLITVLFIGIWFAWRQPETLAPLERIPFSPANIGRGIQEVLTHRIAFGYTVAIGLIHGAFIGYLNSAQQVFQELYGLGKLFPLYFALLSLSLGGASLANARLVMRYGMRALSSKALKGVAILSIIALTTVVLANGQPPIWFITLFFMITFFGVGLLFGNLNALAMGPLGHIAGIGAAVVGSLSMFISLSLGTFIGQSYNGTVLPLVSGFAILSIAAIGVRYWVEVKS